MLRVATFCADGAEGDRLAALQVGESGDSSSGNENSEEEE